MCRLKLQVPTYFVQCIAIFLLKFELFSRKFALLRVFYDKLNSRRFVETEAYSIVNLCSDIGGVFGIVLATSVITFVEFAYAIVGLIIFVATKGHASIIMG